MDKRDLALRNLTYRLFVDLGRAPTAGEVGSAADISVHKVYSGWRRMHEAHAIALDPAMSELRMLNPFSAVPTAHSVEAAGRRWYGNCAWDALGISAALRSDGLIETSCPDCDERISLEVRGERPDDESLLFHCLVPAANWWADIVFT